MSTESSSDVKFEIGHVLFIAAVKILQRLLSIPIGFYISIQQLKIDPVWDSFSPAKGQSRRTSKEMQS